MSAHRHHCPDTQRGRTRRRVLTFAAALLVAGGVTTFVGISSPETAVAATTAVNQCNGDNTGAAREIRCDVTVTNTLDVATGATSSIVTTTACAGAPGEAVCVTTPGALTADIVGTVDQCNGSATAGGSIVTCNVSVINNITGVGSTTPATVNQCVGSGQGGGAEPTTICAPATSVSGADVTQCNGSGNNGGATGRVTCTVPTSTVSELWSVLINQCNGSATGGGDLVTCTAQITTNILAPQQVPTTTDGGTATTTPSTAPATTVSAIPPTGVPTPPAGGAATPTGGLPQSGRNGLPALTNQLPATGDQTTGLAIAALLLTTAGVAALVATRRHAA